MEEYASRRLTFFCARAMKLPTTMVRVARTARMRLQLTETSLAEKTAATSRIMTANPAALEAVDRNPATAEGAPSYVSGAQKWNGNKATLKPSPARIRKVTPTVRTLNSVK